MKCSKTGSYLTDADRDIIALHWNKRSPNGKHVSIRGLAKELGLAEATLRRELKRGCPEGQVSMQYRKNNRVYYEYFDYNPSIAKEIARMNAAQKGPRGKLTNTDVALFLEALEDKKSIRYALWHLHQTHPERKFPCERTLYYYAEQGTLPTKIGNRQYYKSYADRWTYHPPREAKNHTQPHRHIEDLPKHVQCGSSPGYVQMDLVVSGSKGHGALLTMVYLFENQRIPFVRKLSTTSQRTVHNALRSIVKEASKKALTFKYILTDNGHEFLNSSKIATITGADVFYTHAYAGWEKGAVENLNKLIRRYYPKRTDFSKLSIAAISNLQQWLTDYPRHLTHRTEFVS